MLADAGLRAMRERGTPFDSSTKVNPPLRTAEDTAALRVALEDVFWSLLNSREFMFNH